MSALIARHPFAFGLAVFVAMQLWPLHCYPPVYPTAQRAQRI
ncbi:hypothetical protein MycrhN_2543 [Mycolicibacterium rhodesiae NBB3]|uniref:Uncharacterized protein n=1 Tax=Mycolicibacterium rhodesiae (strain NBB3) TaxID=710685 RepID=G8RX80_MYCRN|nr:hypothetical protein MycrhN_2543 [Mycolicibacterium rhodesiae NBB3]